MGTVNIEQSLLWDRTETSGDVFSFPGGAFHILSSHQPDMILRSQLTNGKRSLKNLFHLFPANHEAQCFFNPCIAF